MLLFSFLFFPQSKPDVGSLCIFFLPIPMRAGAFPSLPGGPLPSQLDEVTVPAAASRCPGLPDDEVSEFSFCRWCTLCVGIPVVLPSRREGRPWRASRSTSCNRQQSATVPAGLIAASRAGGPSLMIHIPVSAPPGTGLCLTSPTYKSLADQSPAGILLGEAGTPLDRYHRSSVSIVLPLRCPGFSSSGCPQLRRPPPRWGH